MAPCELGNHLVLSVKTSRREECWASRTTLIVVIGRSASRTLRLVLQEAVFIKLKIVPCTPSPLALEINENYGARVYSRLTFPNSGV